MAQLSWNISTLACSCCRREHSTSGSLRNTWEKPLAQQGLQEVGIFIKSKTDPSTYELLRSCPCSSTCLFFPAIYSTIKYPRSSAKFLLPLHCHVKKLRYPAQPSRTGRALLLPSAKTPSFYQHPSSTKQETPGFVGTRWAAPKANLIPLAPSSYR